MRFILNIPLSITFILTAVIVVGLMVVVYWLTEPGEITIEFGGCRPNHDRIASGSCKSERR